MKVKFKKKQVFVYEKYLIHNYDFSDHSNLPVRNYIAQLIHR